MKKLTLSLMALAMVLTLAQCKKNEPEGDRIVPITLDVQAKSDGSKINVDPNDGTVAFEQNDVVYVGSGGKYVGKLTCRGTRFVGNLTNPVMNEPLYFYFLGNRSLFGEFTPGSSTSCSFDIMDQTDIENMPVISSAISDQDFTGEGTYTAYFRNRAALVMFNVETASTMSQTIIEGMKNFVTVDFVNNTLSYSEMAGGAITLPAGSGERWAILLPQNALAAGNEGSAYSADNLYTGTRGAVPAITANGYYVDGIPVTVKTPTGYAYPPDTPTNVTASVSDNRVVVQWDLVMYANEYYIYRSSYADNPTYPYNLIGSSSDNTFYDNNPYTGNNYYKVSAANDFGQSEMSDYTSCNFHFLPTGAIDGIFTIDGFGSQVFFSKGNLQYQASTNTWRFAEHQKDIIGNDNANISSSYSGWIDLFGWGTSGWNNGNTYYQPYDWDNNGDSNTGYGYGPTDGTDYLYSLYSWLYRNADWGTYNPISGGGNQAGLWHTLEKEQWDFILNTRSTSSNIRFAKAIVDGTNGLILLPDDWSASIYALNDVNEENASFGSNIIGASDWATMEANGAVLLPAAGQRDGKTIEGINNWGDYWSSAATSTVKYAWEMTFYGDFVGSSSCHRHNGCSVRLVRDVQ